MSLMSLLLEGVIVVVGVRRQRGDAPAPAARCRRHTPAKAGAARRSDRYAWRTSASHVHRSRSTCDQRRTRAAAFAQLIRPDQGAFAARPPTRDSYSSPTTPATMAASARLNTYQLKLNVARRDVEQHEIGHRTVGQPVDGVADRAADDQAERQRGEARSARASQIHSSTTASDLEREQHPAAEVAVLREQAVADAGVPGQHEVEERRQRARCRGWPRSKTNSSQSLTPDRAPRDDRRDKPEAGERAPEQSRPSLRRLRASRPIRAAPARRAGVTSG